MNIIINIQGQVILEFEPCRQQQVLWQKLMYNSKIISCVYTLYHKINNMHWPLILWDLSLRDYFTWWDNLEDDNHGNQHQHNITTKTAVHQSA